MRRGGGGGDGRSGYERGKGSVDEPIGVDVPSYAVPDTATTAGWMPEPPGRMRRKRGGDSERGGHDRGNGSVDEPIGIGLDGEGKAEDDGGEEGFRIGNSGSKDYGCARQGVVDAELEANGVVEGIVGRAVNADGDTSTDLRVQRGRTAKAGTDEGSSVERPLIIDEGYGSFSFGADNFPNHHLPDSRTFHSRKQYREIDQLFEDDVEDAVSKTFGRANTTSVEELDRKQKTEEEAAIEKVNTLFRNHHSRARDARAEGQTFQVVKRDGHGSESRGTVDNGRRSLLDVLAREAKPSMQATSIAKRQESSKGSPSLPQWQAELDGRKRDAMARSRSARASDGSNDRRPTVSHMEAEAIRPDPEDDTAEMIFAQELLMADMASRKKAKHEKEQARLRKEKDANERASVVRGSSNTQIAMFANQGKPTKKARLMAAEAQMIAEHHEEELPRKRNADVAKKNVDQLVDRLVLLKKKSDDENSRRIERNRIDEKRRAKAAERAGRSSVRVKVEDSGTDDAVRCRLEQDRAARQAAAERSRSRQAQIATEEKPEIVEARSLEASESVQTSVALRHSSSGDEALVGSNMPSAHSTALESELHRAKEILQAAQKRVFEVEAEASRVQADCTTLKRRAEEADAEDVIDRGTHKRARSIEQSLGVNQSMRSSPNSSSVEKLSGPDRIETQTRRQTPARTSEERRYRKREASKRCSLKKKQEERKLLEERRQQEGIIGFGGSYQSRSSPAKSDDDEGTDSGRKQPMGLRALCTPTLISTARGLQEENKRAKSTLRLQPFITEDQDGHPTSNDNVKTVNPHTNNKAKSNMIRDRAAKDEEINHLKALLATFQQPQTSQGLDVEQTGSTEAYPADSPPQQERQETLSSDEDEDEDATHESQPSHPSRPSLPPQPLTNPDEPQPPHPRPTSARKTLPKHTHAPPSPDDKENPPTTPLPLDHDPPPNELIWGYQITRKEWLPHDDPHNVSHTTDGPYWSKSQANLIAATDVHQERDGGGGGVRILAPMDFNMTIDALGMRTHSICSKGGTIATAVERVLIPPCRASGPMAEKGWLPQRLFVALEKVSGGGVVGVGGKGGGSGEYGQCKSSTRVLGVFTILDLANRRASRCALEHQTARLGESELDQLVRAEKEMKARERLQVLDRESRMFEGSCAVSDGGEVVIWVEEHPVIGPRN